MTSLPLDHVGIATGSIPYSAGHYELLTGATCSPVESLPAHGVNVAFVGPVELLEPTSPDSPIGRFLKRQGPGLHHIAFRVPDLRAHLTELRDAGVHLIDEEPRRGTRGNTVAFVHPKSAGGVLWELVQV